ncbi:unnamed protein product [Caenorhabditis nigoni]
MTKLSDLGYFFDDQGVLRTKKDNEPFKFSTQEAYEELGETVDEEIFRLLEEKCGLEKKALKPADSKEDDEDLSFIFVSKNIKTAQKLLVLMHGSGVVRAGQWARRLIINENLTVGTQIPYIERALSNGWGVLVMNTNMNGSQAEELKYSRTPEEHADTAWKTWVKPSKAKEIYVVAHSRGGYDMTTVLKKHGDDDRISKICLTDSPWFQIPKTCERRAAPLYVVNFLANGNLEKYKIGEYRAGKVQNLFAGTKIHEWSSHFSIDACFKIFEEEFDEKKFPEILESAKFLVLPREERVQRNETGDDEEEEPKEKKICV